MIVVDIGNTNLTFAWFKKGKLTRVVKLDTATISKSAIERVLSKEKNEKILICSVVPKITKIFRKLKTKVYVVGSEVKVPIVCLYDKRKVGMDRLVGAFSAQMLFPRVRFILDFGTAITLDFLSKAQAYQGGIILPGIGSTQKALSNCALLPREIKFKETKKIIPKTTKESISKGLQEGFSLMINGLVKKYKKKLKIKPREQIVITGGEALVVLPKLNFTYEYERYLVLKGLEILSRNLS